MKADGWYPDPSGLHAERWMTAGEPTHLVRDAWVESSDGPAPEPRRVLVAVAPTPTAMSQRSGPVPPASRPTLDAAPAAAPPATVPPTDRRAVVVAAPLGWDTFVQGDRPLANGVAIWLLRSMMDFDDVVTISDVHGSALRCAFYVDLLLGGLVESEGRPPTAHTDLADEAVRDLADHKSLEHWIRLGRPHGHEFADTLVASGDWQPLHYVLYHRYRSVRAPYTNVCRYLADVFDRSDEPTPAVAALAALTGAWGYLGPERRKVPGALLAACGPAADFVGWAAGYLNSRMSDIAAAAAANAQANFFGGGV